MKVRDVMSKPVLKITSMTLLPEVAETMRQENIGILPVEDGGRLVGIITDRDITINAVAQGNVDRPVKDVMTGNPVTISPDAPTETAIQTMLRHEVRRLPVVEGGDLVGIVSLEDLVESGNDEELLSAMRGFHQQTKHD